MHLEESGGASQSIFGSMAAFAASAADGGFEVNEAGGERLIKAIDDFQAWIADQSTSIWYLAQERKLGASAGAQIIAPFVQQVATDEQGFITQLRALGEALVKAREGIELAMKNYRETEEAQAASLRNVEIPGKSDG
jgi:hypothetical protein